MATLDISTERPDHDELPSLVAELQSASQVVAHGRALGESHRAIGTAPGRPRALLSRLARSAEALEEAYALLAGSTDAGRLSSEEWLRDNHHVARDQVREIRVDLPTRFYLELPRLASGPYEGYPRVYHLARELVGPTDGRLDAEAITRFVDAYQESVSLTIGEVWAVGSMLRLALVERLHELAAPVGAARRDRTRAHDLSARLDRALKDPAHRDAQLRRVQLPDGPLSPAFIIELLQWLRDQPPEVVPIWTWLGDQLDRHGGPEEIIRRESQREAAAQLAISNVIGSMRLLSALDWPAFFERVSRVERVLRRDPAGAYPQMDFATRDRYRQSVEELARRSQRDEIAIAERACALAAAAVTSNPGRDRTHHVGYYLISRGRFQIERETGYPPRLGQRLARFAFRHPAAGYLGSIALLTSLPVASLLIYAGRHGAHWPLLLLAALVVVVPISELALNLINRFVTYQIPPRPVPKLDFRSGIPADARTLVVVPTLCGSPERVVEIFEQLEVRALGNSDPHLHFAVLADFPDSATESMPADTPVLAAAAAKVDALNRRYGADRFFYFHRVRRWNAGERCWMGWERKRGKLEQFNRLLRGEAVTDFAVQLGDLSALPRVRYVITLDSDTQLPPGAAVRMIGAMAHPLNRPRFDPTLRRVREGYGVLQPRVDVSLRSASRTLFARTMAGHVGLDPYTTATSDVYQDLFHEGSYVGKGIYDVDAFNAALGGRVRENTLLSHDLFEGFFARAGLATDIHLVDDFPTHYLAWASRLHRWVRGDWQLVGWLLPRVSDAEGRHRNPLPPLARWKVLDNLRRSLLSPSLVALLVLGWTLLPGSAWTWSLLALLVLAYPAYLGLGESLGQRIRGVSLRQHLQRERSNLLVSGRQALLTTVFLLDQARLMLDAIARTLWRLLVSRKRLLQWESASDAAIRIRTDARYVWTRLVGSTIGAVGIAILVLAVHPERLPGALPILICWALAPVVAYETGLPRRRAGEWLADRDRSRLRQIGRLTWRFFDQLATADQHWLIPDNIQDDRPVPIASRTSPTNIGLQLLGTLAAYDLGYLTTRVLVERIDRTLQTLSQLPRYHGHFYNWYDTRNLSPLQPLYVSTVDSGNLVGCLITLREGLREAVAQDPIVDARYLRGLDDQLGLLVDALETRSGRARVQHPHTSRLLRDVALARQRLTTAPRALAGWLWLFEDLADRMDSLDLLLREIEDTVTTGTEAAVPEARYWLTECARSLRERRADLTAVSAHWTDVAADEQPLGVVLPSWEQLTLASATAPGRDLLESASRLDSMIAGLISEMNFEFLYNPERRLFSIGFNVSDLRLDASHYDLLASEARLASFLAIALGQVPHEHWFTLGRAQVPTANGRALLSWSASTFEYLMPLLVMRAYPNTLMEESCQVMIDRQIEYARGFGVAWGISESAYNLRDHDGNYQYRAFGVPGLGLKRGLGDDLVVAPYASLLACPLRPRAVAANLDAIERDSPRGRFGYRDAVDYTGTRLPKDARFALVDTYMAHHQGMILAAIDNVVSGGALQRRFHREPRIQAVDLLLHERIPPLVPLSDLPIEEMSDIRTARSLRPPPVRRYETPHTAGPRGHLLSNGRYSVLITNAGSGYSRCGEIMLTRWREDPTLDNRGTYCYVRDVESGFTWSAAYQPTLVDGEQYEAIFAPDRATFRRRDGTIELHTEIAVSPEDDVELRRVSVTNLGREARHVELTSYAEVVLAPQGADVIHPSFGNLFVETESVPDRDALICHRRPRGDEPSRYLVHVVASRGLVSGGAGFESDRLRFVGRLNDLRRPDALKPAAKLSNTTGATLDPIVSLRHRVRIPPGVTARVSFITGYAESHDAALALVEKYSDRHAVTRGLALAGSHSQVEMRHLNLTAEEVNEIARLASRLRFADRRLRSIEDVAANRQPIAGLWKHGISGDLPILLVRAADGAAIPLVRQALAAREYCHLKGFNFDLVVLSEQAEGYRKDFYDQLVALVASSAAAAWLDKPGGIFIRRVDLMTPEDVVLLRAVARAVLDSSRGDLAAQLEIPAPPEAAVTIGPAPKMARADRRRDVPPTTSRQDVPPVAGLQHFNGWGGFVPSAREYVIIVDTERPTPAPWANVIATEEAGLLATEAGPRTIWAGNSQWNRLTPWSNDAVMDSPTAAVYLRDAQSGRLWSPTVLPCGAAPTIVSHGLGYTRYEQATDEWRTALTVTTGPDGAVILWRLALTNRTSASRDCAVTGYVEWTLGDTRERTAPHIVTRLDERGVLLATNPIRESGGERVAFFQISERDGRACADRGLFLGRNGRYDSPAGLAAPTLPQRVGAGLDPCGAIQTRVSVAAGETHELVFAIGEAADAATAVSLAAAHCSPAAFTSALGHQKETWSRITGALQVATPDPGFDVLVNDWLLYQTLSCRIWGRTAFYQSSGAFGFRDQLQDVLALCLSRPDIARAHLLRAASHQFVEGDVQHWWHEPTGHGVRTHFSDDRLWLVYASMQYADATGDTGVFDEVVPFIAGRLLGPGEDELFDRATPSGQQASLYEHCARAFDRSLETGAHGLPLIGTGDWNDGMNRVGREGRGESVWLAWFHLAVLPRFAAMAESRGDAARAHTWTDHVTRLREAVEEAWDGAWYRRAYFDDGSPLGAAINTEGRIDALAQAWAVLSGPPFGRHAREAMASAYQWLVRHDEGLVLLLSPPFDTMTPSPGYIQGYLPGIRENGGQYTHASLWLADAFARLGDGNRAVELLHMINPITHSRDADAVRRYRVEPYVVAADVYSTPPHVGRGGWTWYTGAAGWMYRVSVESVLGLHLASTRLRIAPSIPANWPGFSAVLTRPDGTRIRIEVRNPDGVMQGLREVRLDGQVVAGTEVALPADGAEHELVAVMGVPAST
jgi:cyclic beta-1,2-glucan synthetase